MPTYGKTRVKIAAFAIGALSLLLLCPSALALDPSLDVSQYAHMSWRVRDGFTRGTILAITQTPDGYLWLGTEFGLYRFDGVRAFHGIRRQVRTSLQSIFTACWWGATGRCGLALRAASRLGKTASLGVTLSSTD